jgi:glycosyltransferase involved in cell wall biosynthesis
MDWSLSDHFDNQATTSVSALVRQHKPDGVIFCASSAGVHFVPNDVPRVLYCDSTFHRLVVHTPNLPTWSPMLRARIDEAEGRRYRRFDHIFPFSTAVADDLMGHYGVAQSRVTVALSGLGRVRPFHGRKDFNRQRVLFVARRAFSQKGGDLVVAGFKIAQRTLPCLELLIDGGAIAENDARLTPGMRWSNAASLQALEELFASASLFAMPALFEPWGNVFVEALATRTPVLGLARHSLYDITNAGRFGFLVERAEPAAIAEALVNAFADPVRLERMALDGQRWVLERFTWERVAQTMCDCLGNLARNVA